MAIMASGKMHERTCMLGEKAATICPRVTPNSNMKMMTSNWKPVPFSPALPCPKPMGKTCKAIRPETPPQSKNIPDTHHQYPIQDSTDNTIWNFTN